MLQDFIVYTIIFIALFKTGISIWNFFAKKEKATSNYSGCTHCTSGYIKKMQKLNRKSGN